MSEYTPLIQVFDLPSKHDDINAVAVIQQMVEAWNLSPDTQGRIARWMLDKARDMERVTEIRIDTEESE